MEIQGSIFSIPYNCTRQLQKVQLADIKRRIDRAAGKLQWAQKFFPCQAKFEEIWASIPRHLKFTTSISTVTFTQKVSIATPFQLSEPNSDSYAQLIWLCHEKYPDLEHTELALITVEALIDSSATNPVQRALIGKVWAELFQQPEARWAREIEATALTATLFLLEMSFNSIKVGSERDFKNVYSFLQALERILEHPQEWAAVCVEKISLPHRHEFYQALTKKCGLMSHLCQELFVRLFLEEVDQKPLSESLTKLEKEKPRSSVVWAKLLEKIASSEDEELKQKAWQIWLEQSKALENDAAFLEAWQQVSSLVSDDFFCSETFEGLMSSFDIETKMEGTYTGWLEFYDQVLECADKSAEKVCNTHKNYMLRYPELKNQRTNTALTRLENSGEELNYLLFDLENGMNGSMTIWLKLIEKGTDSDMKERIWQLWASNPEHNSDSYAEVWVAASKLLNDVPLIDAASFFSSEVFARLIDCLIKRKVNCSSLYQRIYHLAKKEKDVDAIHQGFMSKHSGLKEAHIQLLLDRFQSKSENQIRTLEELEGMGIADINVWSKVLEKICSNRQAKECVKKKAWEIWCAQAGLFIKEKAYGKVWLQAAELLSGEGGEAAFCHPDFQKTVESLASCAIPFYKSVINGAKKSAKDIPQIFAVHQRCMENIPALRTVEIFKHFKEMINEHLKKEHSESAFVLLQYYLQNADIEVRKEIAAWLISRLGVGSVKKGCVDDIVKLLEALLEQPGLIDCEAIAKTLNLVKCDGFKDIALRFAFKGLLLNDPKKKGQVDHYLDFIAEIVSHTTDDGILLFIKQEKVEEFEKYIDKRPNFWKALAIRSLKICKEPEAGFQFAAEIWRMTRNNDAVAKVILVEIVKSILSILPNEEAFTTICRKLAEAFLKMPKNMAGRPIDQFLRCLCQQAENSGHGVTVLRIACHIVGDKQQIQGYVDAGSAKDLAENCFKQVNKIKSDTEAESFFATFRDLLQTPEMKSYYETSCLNDEKYLDKLLAIHAYPLYKKTMNSQESDENKLQSYFESMTEMIKDKTIPLAVKKIIWQFSVKLAADHVNDISFTAWKVNLARVLDQLDPLVEGGVQECDGQYTISSDYLNDVIEACHLIEGSLVRAKRANSRVAEQVLWGVMKLADFQIRYRHCKTDLKKEIVHLILELAMPLTPSNAMVDWIVQYAIDAMIPLPDKVINIHGLNKVAQIVAGEREFATISPVERKNLERKGFTNLFQYLLDVSKKDNIWALVLASRLLKMGHFHNFHNAHFHDLLRIFKNLIEEAEFYNRQVILESEFFDNIFHALTHKRKMEKDEILTGTVEWEQATSIKELFGSEIAEEDLSVKGLYIRTVDSYFKTCVSKENNTKNYLNDLKQDLKNKRVESFIRFRTNCIVNKLFTTTEIWRKFPSELNNN